MSNVIRFSSWLCLSESEKQKLLKRKGKHYDKTNIVNTSRGNDVSQGTISRRGR